ncbi:solute carrier family 35 member G1-like, partial [Saccoglossus kowalevskii]|uniref:Uncharacterized protein LOC102803435 n=1 Tax=Saccoglossus kowalevskii TaxID=10224 RepID=A0ABM0MWL4_SACKO
MVESKSRKRKKTSSEKEPSANNMKQERLKNSKSEEKKSLLMRAAGLLFAVGAGMCVAMSSVFVKKLSNDLSSLEIAVWRGIGNTILVFSYLVVTQDSGIFSGFNRNTFSLVLTRSVMFSIAIVLAFTVSQNLPLGDASALMSTSTIITGFLGIFILDEKWKLRDMLLSILCWCGVVLISRPSFLLNLLEDTPVVADDSRHRLTYIGFAIACATLTSMSHILVRKVGHRLDVAKITLFAEAVGFICSFLTLIWQEGEIRIPPENSWKYLLPICVA